MLEHLNTTSVAPRRCVVIGGAGFVGRTVARRVEAEGIPTLALPSTEVDLLADAAASRLAGRLEPDDAVVLVSALAPCKDVPTLVRNLRMADRMAALLHGQPETSFFFAVGAAHFVGVDGLPALMEQHGFKVNRQVPRLLASPVTLP